jgi:23S rRNA (cytidine1920-2'-O)/16S rRNA (cytidine1409-2'-O)-methyltransferase
MPKKLPLSLLLLKQFPRKTKDEILSAIVMGEISSDTEVFRNPKQMVDSEKVFQWQTYDAFVSRGGDKLAGFFEEYSFEIRKKIVLDAGCSTGGFTDFLLKKGAKTVYAVDVGYNQLDFRLRNDQRVIVMERTNIMDLEPLSPAPDFAVCDLSFRSVNQAASKILSLTSSNLLFALVKPQFERKYFLESQESPSDKESFQGVIGSHEEIKKILMDLGNRLGDDRVLIKAVKVSKLVGTKGNSEYFFVLKKAPLDSEVIEKNHELLSSIL